MSATDLVLRGDRLIYSSDILLPQDARTTTRPSLAAYDAFTAEILATHPALATIQDHHLHVLDEHSDLYAIDQQFSNSLWTVIKDLSRRIQRAADPSIGPFAYLSNQIEAAKLERIGMPYPQILAAENWPQAPTVFAGTRAHCIDLITKCQDTALAAIEWIAKAKEHCAAMDQFQLPHDWNWFASVPSDVERFAYADDDRLLTLGNEIEWTDALVPPTPPADFDTAAQNAFDH